MTAGDDDVGGVVFVEPRAPRAGRAESPTLPIKNAAIIISP